MEQKMRARSFSRKKKKIKLGGYKTHHQQKGRQTSMSAQQKGKKVKLGGKRKGGSGRGGGRNTLEKIGEARCPIRGGGRKKQEDRQKRK